MTTFMDTMHGLLKGETVPVDEEGILPGVQDMMRTMGHNGVMTAECLFLNPMFQDLVDRGFVYDRISAAGMKHTLALTDKGKAYIARIGGEKKRSVPPTVTFTAGTVIRGSTPLPPPSDEPA